MAEVEDAIKEALEAIRAKELLFRRESASLGQTAALLAQSLGASRTLHVYGEGSLALLAKWVAHRFHTAEGGEPLRAVALGAMSAEPEAALREARAFVERGDVVLALALEGGRGAAGRVLDTARAKGAATLAVSGYPGDGLAERADAAVIIPSRREPVLAENVVAVANVLERLVAKKLGLEPGARTQGDPFDSRTGSSEELASSSGEAVVAELVDPRPRAIPPVELVPLRADPAGSSAPAPANTIRFRCTACGGSISVEGKFSGRRGQCPECLHEFTIPRAEEPSPASSAAVSASAHRSRDPEGSATRRAATKRPPQEPVPGTTGGPQERRRANRVFVTDARVAYAHDAFPGENQPPVYHALEDLSLTGLSFTAYLKGLSTSDVKVGDSLFMHLDFPAYVDKVRVQGEVRRVGLLPDRSGIAIGVRFSRFLDDAQAKVRRLVENANLRGVRRR